jgi:hypothetical protein
MRFKDFDIVIHGDFESGGDELDLRGAIAKKLGMMMDPQAAAKEKEAAEIEKIEQGKAKWSTPLQQHLDAVKQTADAVSENPDGAAAAVTVPSGYDNMMRESISACRWCGRLMMPQQLSETKQQRLLELWQQKRAHTPSQPQCGSPGSQHRQCHPLT